MHIGSPLWLRRFLRYSVVGMSTFLLDLALLYVAASILGVPYYFATVGAFLIAVTINYTISRRIVFVGTERSWHGGYAWAALLSVAAALLTSGLVVVLVECGHLHYLFARIIVASGIGIAGYIISLHWNFRVAGREL